MSSETRSREALRQREKLAGSELFGAGEVSLSGELSGCVDERDHAAGVWCVAEVSVGVGVVLLAEEADVVA
jgi:hypothetical protein